jgi:hypothetical protein
MEYIMYAKTLAALVESVNTAQAEKLEQMAASAMSLLEKHESALPGEAHFLSPQSLENVLYVLEAATAPAP